MLIPKILSSTAIAVVSYAVFNMFSCGTPAINTGIRIRSELLDSAFQTPNTGAPVPGVSVSGIFISYYSSSHNGDQEVIGGTTDGLGILDSPNAITGAYWNFGADFTPSAVPACGTASDKNVVMVYAVAEELFSCFPTTGPE